MEFLNEIEKEEIQKFLDNPTLKEAVKKVLLRGIYFDGVLRPGEKADITKNFMLGLASNHMRQGLSNEILGQDVRAIDSALSILEGSFNELEALRKIKVEDAKKPNPAR